MTEPIAVTSHLGSLFAIASHAAERATEHPLDNTLVAILFSAAAIEGRLNEILEHLEWRARGADANRLPESVRNLVTVASELESRNAQLHLKLHVYCALLSGQSFDKSTTLYQDFDLLVRIRNSLVHLRPESVQAGAEEPGSTKRHSIVGRLVSRGIVSRAEADQFWMLGWMGIVHGPAVARWAYATAENLVAYMESLLPPGDWRQGLRLYRPMAPGA